MNEMEEEAKKLREYQADVDEEMNLSSSSLPGVQSPQFLSHEEKEEVDGRSIYVGNVSTVIRTNPIKMIGGRLILIIGWPQPSCTF